MAIDLTLLSRRIEAQISVGNLPRTSPGERFAKTRPHSRDGMLPWRTALGMGR